MLRMLLLLLFVLTSSCSSKEKAPAQPVPVTTSPTRSSESTAAARDEIIGQTIYVPVYSHIYMRDKSRMINLTATLSIRNTDAQNAIRISAVRYYDTHGALLREYINEPLTLTAMASTEFVVAEDDTSGGAGANFIVEWGAGSEVTQPVVEAVMISTASQQGISFVSAGRVIKDRAKR
ncbi:MAG: DUF3124 domain-containing protein [Acidobacteriota bacterium]